MPEQNVIAGVDLGATNVRVGLFTPQGVQLAQSSVPLEAKRGPQSGIQRTIEQIEAALQKIGPANLLGIGIGATGPVDPFEGTIKNPYTLPSWQHVPFTTPLSNHFGVPAVLENDADAAALGEYWLGAGRGIAILMAVTVGTGIGTAVILNGKIYRGLNGAHPEGGHHILDLNGPECYCGAHGCWESLASGEALGCFARERGSQDAQWLQSLAGGKLSRVNGELVAKAAGQGDEIALELMNKEAYYLALGLVNMVILYTPEVIVLSGGVLKNYQLFEPEIKRAMQQHNLMVPATDVRIVPAQLGYYAGIAGAAFALLSSLDQTV